MDDIKLKCPNCSRNIEMQITCQTDDNRKTEKENRGRDKHAPLKWAALILLTAGAIICGGLAAGIFRGTGAGGKIRASQFILVDEHGKARAVIEMAANGPRIVMYDESGRARAGFGIDRDGPKLDMSDETSIPRAMIRLNKDGPMLAMSDEIGRPRLGMGVATNGPGLAMSDESGAPRLGIGVDNNGPRSAMSDETGLSRIALGVDLEGPKLDMSDETGRRRAGLGVTVNGPMLAMSDGAGKPRIGIGVDREGPRLAISDQNGQPRAAMRMDKDGPKMNVSDESGKQRAGLGMDNNAAMLMISDEADKYRTTLSMDKDGARLELSDELKKTHLKELLARIPEEAGANVSTPINYFSVRRPPLECPGISTNAPVIDGRLDENCWKKAGVTTAFLEKDTGEEAVHKTKAYILHDNINIYLGITCSEPQPEMMLAAITNRDGAVWNENEIEVFFDMQRNGNRIRQFCINSLGAQSDQKIDGGKEDIKWNSAWIARTSVQSGGWTAELAIPLKDLDVNPPLPNDIWGINICRVRRIKTGAKDKKTETKPEYSCFSPTFGAFFKPERFGDLIFR